MKMDENAKNTDNISVDEFTRLRIDELCKEMHMTKYRLGVISGVAQSSFSTIMSGKTSPSLNTLKKICDAFGISLFQFFNKDFTVSKHSAKEHLWLDLMNSLDESELDMVIGYIQGIKAAKEKLTIAQVCEKD